MLFDVAKVFSIVLLVACIVHASAGSSRALTKVIGQVVNDARTRAVAGQQNNAKHLRSLKQTLDAYECFLIDQTNCEVSSQPISADAAGNTGYINNNDITGMVCATDQTSASQACNQFCNDVINEASVDDDWSFAVLSVQVDADPYCNTPDDGDDSACAELGLGADCAGGYVVDWGDR